MSKTNSFSPLGILLLIFITLKLAGIGVVARWSWWWVTAPFWGCLLIVIGAIVWSAIAHARKLTRLGK